VKGVTGSAALDTEEVARKVEKIQQQTDLPVGVGFGIKDGATAAQVASVADGVIVGSVLVNAIAEAAEQKAPVEDICSRLSAILRDMRQAMDNA
jgi:tryptophan synthase alpha chain